MSKDKVKKPAFGGVQFNFAGCTDTMETIFGTADIGPAQMTARIWEYAREKGIVPPKKSK